ncbi:hypothetical protein LINPERPRIM_LOCUS15078 [Linum perenne]
MIEGEIKARCKYCQKLLAGSSNNGTTHLKTHMGNYIQRKIHDRSQRFRCFRRRRGEEGT